MLELAILEDRLLMSIVPNAPALSLFDNGNLGQQSLDSHQSIAEASSGNFSVVWDDTDLGGIYTELFASSTQKLTEPTLVGNTTSADSQATVSCDANGDFVVAWTHTNTDGTTQIEAQIFSSSGVGGKTGTLSPAGSWSRPTVSVTDAADFLIAYASNSGGSSVVQVTKVSVISSNSWFPDSGVSVTNATDPSLATNSLGEGVLAYTEVNALDQFLIVQKLFAGSGNANGAPLSLVFSPSDLITQPSVGIDTQGDIDVAYTEVVNQTVVNNPPFAPFTVYQSDVRVTRFNPDGSNAGTIAVTSSTSSTNSGYSPSLTMDSAGNIVVACEVGDGYGHTEGYDQNTLVANAYSSTGAFLQSLSLPAPNPNSLEDFLPSVALNPSGQLVASFVDETPGIGGEFPPPIDSVYVQTFMGEPFQYQLLGNRTITLYTGVPSSLELLDITPDAGFSASQISLAFETLPAGISASVNQIQTVGRSDFRFEVTLTADTSITSFESFDTSFNLVSAGYLTVISPIFQVNVFPSAITSISPVDSNGGQGNALLTGFPALIFGSGFLPGSSVIFAAVGGGGLEVTPSLITPTEITVKVPDNTETGSVVTVVRPTGTPLVSSPITIGGPVITQLSATDGYAPGYSVEYLTTGSSVTIYGAGFRLGSMVQFGKSGTKNTIEAALLAAATAVSPNGDWLTVNVPSTAVTGPVYVEFPGGLFTPASTQTFTVHTYRNTFGFTFPNTNGFEVTQDLFEGEYPGQFGLATAQNAEDAAVAALAAAGGISGFFTFGVSTILLSASVAAAAAVVAADLAFQQGLLIAAKTVESSTPGECYGFLVTSLLLDDDPEMVAQFYQDQVSAGKSQPNPDPTVGDLLSTSELDSDTPESFPELQTDIQQNFLGQFSDQVAHAGLDWITSSHTDQSVYDDILGDLQQGQHPIIGLLNVGHCVTAYGLEPGTPGEGDYYIDVYDSDQPETSDEDLSGMGHLATFDLSRIHIVPGVGWSFTHNKDPYTGGFGTLVVLPTSVVQPQGSLKLPDSLTDVGRIVFGSPPSTSLPGADLIGADPIIVTTQPPATVVAGVPFSVTVTHEDALGNVITSFNGSDTITDQAGGPLGGTTTVQATNGIATFTGLTLSQPGPDFLNVSSTGLTTAATNFFNVQAAPATKLVVAVSSEAPLVATVNAVDAFGNVDTSFSGRVTVGLLNDPTGATLTSLGGLTAQAVNGVATFDNLGIATAGTGYTLQATSTGLTAGTSAGFDISAGAAVVVTPPPQKVTAGAAFGLVVNVGSVLFFNGSMTIALVPGSPSTTLGGTLMVPVVQGVATFAGLSLTQAGSYRFLLTGSGFTGTTTSVTIVGGAATQLAVTAQPAAVTTGVGFGLTVTAEDAFGNAAPQFSGSVTLALANNPTGAALGGTLTVTAIGGVATLAGLTLNKPGTGYTVEAVAGGLHVATSGAINAVAPGVATRLLVTTEPPSGVVAGSGFGLVVKALDDLGTVDASFSGVVSIASSASGPPLAVVTAVNGVATFTGISITGAGTYSLEVSSDGLASAPVGLVTISPAPAVQLVVSAPDSAVITGFAFGLVVEAEDQYGNVNPTALGSVALTLSSNPGGATLGGTLTAQISAGIAVFTSLTINSVGVGYQLQANGLGLSAGTSALFNVTTDQLVIATEPPDSVAAGTGFGLVVNAEDGNGNLDTSFNGQFSIALLSSGLGTPVLAGTVTLTAVEGTATFSGLTVSEPGSYELSVTSAGLPSVITGAVNIMPAPATQLVVSGEPPTSLTVGQAFAVTVTAVDAFGNVDPSFEGALSLRLGNSPTGGVLGGTLTATAVNGAATFVGLTISKPGSGYTLTTSRTGLTGATSTGINVTSAGVATKLVVTSQPPGNTAAGSSFGLVIIAEDGVGTIATSFNGSINVSLSNSPTAGTLMGTVTVAVINGVASFAGLTLSPTGLYTLTVSTAGLPAVTTNQFSIVAGTASQLVVTGLANPIFANKPFPLQVEFEDAAGNIVPNYSGSATISFHHTPGNTTLGGTVTVAAVNGRAVFDNLTISAAGTGYTLQATSAGLSVGITPAFDVVTEQLVATTLPPTAVAAGTGFGFTVASETSNGTVDTSFNGVVTVSAANLFPSLPTTLGGSLTVTAVNGVATFSALTLAQSGDYSLSLASIGSSTTTLTNYLEVSAGPATHLAVTIQAPQDVTTGATFSVAVAALDAQGNINLAFNGLMSLALGNNPTGGILGGTLTATAVNGVATFSGLIINKPGDDYTIRATSSGLTSTTSNGVNITALAVATTLVVTTQPALITSAGSRFGLVVEAEDSLGTLDRNFGGSVTIAVDNNVYGVPLDGTSTVTAVNGVATFSGLMLMFAGDYALSVSAGGLAPVTTHSITVNAASATQIAVERPTANVIPGVPFTSKVYAVDPYGNLDPSFNGSVTIDLGSNLGSSDLGGTRTLNAVQGIADFSTLTLNNLGDGYTLQGTALGLTGGTSLPFDVAVVNPPITLIPATLPAAELGTTYAQLLTSLGGTGGGYTYAVTSGTLPSWLSLSSDTGLLAGTVPLIGSGAIVFTVTASDGTSDSGSQEFTLNTIPISSVNSLPAVESNLSFTITWTGQPNTNGSSISNYSIYVADDGSAFLPFLTDTTATSALFTGVRGHSYGFYSVASDNLGNVQPTPAAAQATTSIVIPAAISSTFVGSSEDPANYSDIVSFTAVVNAANPVNGTPTGTLQFQIDGADFGSPIGLINGSASITSAALAPGNHTITASYMSDTGLFASSAGTVSGGQTVIVPTAASVSVSASSDVVGQSVTFTAIFNAIAAGSPAPSGTVTFTDGSTVLGTASLSGGVAQFTTSNLALGPHSIQALYQVGGEFIGTEAAGIAIGLTVGRDGSAIIVTPSANPSPPNHALTLTANVLAATPGGGVPSGTVTFYNGKKKLGTATLNDGVAIIPFKKLTKGAHTITVVYSGDPDFKGITSAGLREVIKQPAKPRKPKANTNVALPSTHLTTAHSASHRWKSTAAKGLHDMALETLTAPAIMKTSLRRASFQFD